MENREQLIRRTAAGREIEIRTRKVGEDYLALVEGGEKPHIGCSVIAVPRASLTGNGVSATSSVINVTGHKDDIVCREVAEFLCRKYQRTVVCTGGIHIDGITADQIREITDTVKEMLEEL